MKIADFGLSRLFLENAVSKTICGTPAYVAPEVIMCMEASTLHPSTRPPLPFGVERLVRRCA